MSYLEKLKRLEQAKPKAESSADDPVLTVAEWYPEFHRLHTAVIAETPDFDYGWLRQNRPDIFQRIKAKESEIDALETARLSEVISMMTDWRRLVREAQLEQQRSEERSKTAQ